jgi:hypothetical protein
MILPFFFISLNLSKTTRFTQAITIPIQHYAKILPLYISQIIPAHLNEISLLNKPRTFYTYLSKVASSSEFPEQYFVDFLYPFVLYALLI